MQFDVTVKKKKKRKKKKEKEKKQKKEEKSYIKQWFKVMECMI